MFKTKNLIWLVCFVSFLSACGSDKQTPSQTSETPDDQPTPILTPTPELTSTPVPEITSTPEVSASKTNILLIIADDQGLDASNQYSLSDDLPETPALDELANSGVIFDNAWATPACTTTRATILTGKYGVNSGVTYVPAVLDSQHTILQKYLKNNVVSSEYKSAVFGKWHVGGGNNANVNHPAELGVDYYAGNLGNISDYYQWSLTVNGSTETVNDYHTSKITDLAISWIAEQNSPWFAWVAYSAPHDPFHLPPTDLHQRNLSGSEEDINNNKREYYLAAIEAMDSEIDRLLTSLDEEERNNTLIIYMGDNGTPAGVIDRTAYDRQHAKGTLYQGGVAVPLIVSGKGVSRHNVRESALVNATDLYATIAQAAGNTQSRVNDSYSFYSLLSQPNASKQNYLYTEFESTEVTGLAVRSADYKLIEFSDGQQALYALNTSFAEDNNLLPTNDAQLLAQVNVLTDVANNFVNGLNNEVIDITNTVLTNSNANCADYVNGFSSSVTDVNNNQLFMGDLTISVSDNSCIFTTNAIPNHDFNDGNNAFPNNVSAQNDQFSVTTTPTKASNITELSLQVDNAILLNGVKVDLLAAGCFGIGNGKVGCNDGNDWRYDPMHAANGFNVDSHNAHSQSDGTYHYHGSPLALFAESAEQISPVIGFAADGFPIFGSYFDDNGTIRKATPSYRLKAGTRPSGAGQPGGSYDGAFRDDYEYIENLGDLDQCNGMVVNGSYGYYVTDDYPYVLACFTGTPDSSFTKSR